MTGRIIKLLVSLIVRCFDACCARLCRAAGIGLPGTCVVLYYHAVPRQHQACFRAQMECLKGLAVPVPAGYTGPLEPGRRYAAVTFDDGFISFIDQALPVLRHLRIPAAVFVPAGFLGQKPGWMADAAEEVVLSSAQIKSLAGDPLIAIGSHCLTHTGLLRLDGEGARHEIRESKRILQDITGTEVSLLSFPHGAYGREHVRQAADAGYSRVFGILPVRFAGAFDAFDAGRVAVEPDDWPLEFRLKLLGAYRWLPLAFRLKQFLFHKSSLFL